MEFIKPTNIVKYDTFDYSDYLNLIDDDMDKANHINSIKKDKKYDDYFPKNLIPDICNIILSYLNFVENEYIHISVPLYGLINEKCLLKRTTMFFCGLEDESELAVFFNGYELKISGYYPLYLPYIYGTEIKFLNSTTKHIILKIKNIFAPEELKDDFYIVWKKDYVREFKDKQEAINYVTLNKITTPICHVINGHMRFLNSDQFLLNPLQLFNYILF